MGKLSQQLTTCKICCRASTRKFLAMPAAGACSERRSCGAADRRRPGPSAANVPLRHAWAIRRPPGLPPISADTLYQNALRDFTSGKYDLARQEFSDYIKNFPSNDLASNSQFYLGEISYAQNDFKDAITAYDTVLENYPHSFKLAASEYQEGPWPNWNWA